MTEITKYEPGTFCWEDLYISDVVKAKSFYQSLFGWKVESMRIGAEPTYSYFSVKGKEVCGFFEINRQEKTIPHWQTYVSVSNVDESVQIAKVAGGTIIEAPKEISNVGRTAVIQDPTGGILTLWEPGSKIGALVSDLPGTAGWRELNTSNIDVAGKFYSTLFSWDLKPDKFGDMAYVTFKLGTKSVGGMLGHLKEGASTNWLTYWNVKNCDKSLKKADSLGARILRPTTAVKGVGQFAVLSDPFGAVFAILQRESK
ncbi:MAG: VOC family protein [Bdellovibrio sp.]|nr:VOC family protein [Bdellovibrio sp.]